MKFNHLKHDFRTKIWKLFWKLFLIFRSKNHVSNGRISKNGLIFTITVRSLRYDRFLKRLLWRSQIFLPTFQGKFSKDRISKKWLKKSFFFILKITFYWDFNGGPKNFFLATFQEVTLWQISIFTCNKMDQNVMIESILRVMPV